MKTIVQFIFACLVVGVLALIVRVNLAAWSNHPSVVATLPPAPTATLVGASVPPATGYVDLTGVILLDASHGYPPVPFLQYATANKGVATKQLVFPYSRACSVYAGDLPCVATDEAQAYPQIPTGTQVHIRGMLKDDRILVYQID